MTIPPDVNAADNFLRPLSVHVGYAITPAQRPHGFIIQGTVGGREGAVGARKITSLDFIVKEALKVSAS